MEILQLSDLLPYYILRDSTVTKSVVFEVSRYYTETKSSAENKGSNWRPWDQIAPSLYLGKIPSVGKSYYSALNQHEEIIDFVKKNEEIHPLGLVVSAVDYFELSGYSVVSPNQWAEKNVQHLMLPVSDFSTNISNDSIIAAVNTMHDCIEGGKSVYVHCKAGRSRSAMVSAIYLGVYGENQNSESSFDIDEIEKLIVKKRPQVSLNKGQREKAVEVIGIMKKMQKEQAEKTVICDSSPRQASNLTESLKEYLSSLELKNAIVHFNSFKMMAIYACSNQNWKQTSGVTNDIKDFFKSIYDADDNLWYLYLVNSAGPLQKLIDEPAPSYVPYGLSMWKSDNTPEYKKECGKLRGDFIEELNNHLAHVFNCTVNDIKSAALDLSVSLKNITSVVSTQKIAQSSSEDDVNLGESFVVMKK